MKKHIIYSAVFIALGIACGVFFREFSKAYGVVNTYTVLGLVHPHFLVLGGMFMLVIGLVTEKLGRNDSKLYKIALNVYTAGVACTGAMLLVRGILDVLVKSTKTAYSLSKGANGAISGITGIFHALLGVGIALIFIAWLIKEKPEKKTEKE